LRLKINSLLAVSALAAASMACAAEQVERWTPQGVSSELFESHAAFDPKEARAGVWTVENLGPAINTAGDEYEPLPSPDGKMLVLNAEGGMFVSNRVDGRWSPRTLLGPAINVSGTEIGALFSPSGHSLMFARDTGEPL